MTNVVTLEWHGDELADVVENHIARRLDDAAEFVRSAAAARLGRPDLGQNHRSSSPGEYPRSASGRLREHLFSDSTDRLTRRVFTDLEYGLSLELGTDHMQPRPFLTQALRDEAARLADILTAGVTEP